MLCVIFKAHPCLKCGLLANHPVVSMALSCEAAPSCPGAVCSRLLLRAAQVPMQALDLVECAVRGDTLKKVLNKVRKCPHLVRVKIIQTVCK